MTEVQKCWKKTHTHTHGVPSLRWLSNPSHMKSVPSFDACYYESRWHCHARSNSGRAGNPGNGGSDTGSLSCHRSDSRSRRWDDRLIEWERKRHNIIHRNKHNSSLPNKDEAQETLRGRCIISLTENWLLWQKLISIFELKFKLELIFWQFIKSVIINMVDTTTNKKTKMSKIF